MTMLLLVSLGNVSLGPKKVCGNQIPILNDRNSGFVFLSPPLCPSVLDTYQLSSKQSFTVQSCSCVPWVINCPTS